MVIYIISFRPVAAASTFSLLGSEQAITSKENETECVRIKASANSVPEVEGIILISPPSILITKQSDNSGAKQNQYGQNFLERLPKNIGRADVDDVVTLTRTVLAFRSFF